MVNAPINKELIDGLKAILLRLQRGESSEIIETCLARQIQDVDMTTIQLIVQELKNGNHLAGSCGGMMTGSVRYTRGQNE
ncbi:DUF438 domain-containing protein [Oceanobacillus alkalisoli]|uniref:DUF438 domain-containing protein n=1 Tax=Oceanobacillus alkalisoli TaxID=2925113 RepID=UPI001EF046F7|nr:DUF438 domain-containing protein [Oceanobacillus alkalisoli]MCF3943703.1 DUF438 domain-containing protein [Oceanobacillus alkalisoli]MCG5104114.1 DUF438 domain-containing protein [Oceanobacillus alkalisoli]